MDRNLWWGVRKAVGSLSLSARRAWIEIRQRETDGLFFLSLSARRAWIEIANFCKNRFCPTVALRKESVDRNYYADKDCDWVRVALRKESVDRNVILLAVLSSSICRSPQGERG